MSSSKTASLSSEDRKLWMMEHGVWASMSSGDYERQCRSVLEVMVDHTKRCRVRPFFVSGLVEKEVVFICFAFVVKDIKED